MLLDPLLIFVFDMGIAGASIATAIAPALFADAGPGCLRGACPEGEKSCGKAGEIRRTRREWLDSLADEQKKQNQSTDNE